MYLDKWLIESQRFPLLNRAANSGSIHGISIEPDVKGRRRVSPTIPPDPRITTYSSLQQPPRKAGATYVNASNQRAPTTGNHDFDQSMRGIPTRPETTTTIRIPRDPTIHVVQAHGQPLQTYRKTNIMPSASLKHFILNKSAWSRKFTKFFHHYYPEKIEHLPETSQ